MHIGAMNGIAWDLASVSVLSDSTDACESFLESYSRGNVDVGGILVPELAKLDISDEVLVSGHFEPPLPPDETQRVRELYVPLLSQLIAQISIPCAERAQPRYKTWLR